MDWFYYQQAVLIQCFGKEIEKKTELRVKFKYWKNGKNSQSRF